MLSLRRQQTLLRCTSRLHLASLNTSHVLPCPHLTLTPVRSYNRYKQSKKDQEIKLLNQVNKIETPQQRVWHLYDATDQIVGRLAQDIAAKLMGKYKPTYQFGADVGDHVVVVNCEKVQFFHAYKTKQMVYHRHSGWPGGLKTLTAYRVLQTHPERVLIHAVRGSLPKNKSRDIRMARLHLYKGPVHPHYRELGALSVVRDPPADNKTGLIREKGPVVVASPQRLALIVRRSKWHFVQTELRDPKYYTKLHIGIPRAPHPTPYEMHVRFEKEYLEKQRRRRDASNISLFNPPEDFKESVKNLPGIPPLASASSSSSSASSSSSSSASSSSSSSSSSSKPSSKGKSKGAKGKKQ
eukprot:TRINITY_DN648_c2_g4_i1.p1 TRINITY_DN648_c2_g4~~TRINITY_DN648_c2_g4_i1.p1  ORF type:complete len:369 (-),score=127.69 TRINITY_DN648_c2_g4_i1:188-1246(-)